MITNLFKKLCRKKHPYPKTTLVVHKVWIYKYKPEVGKDYCLHETDVAEGDFYLIELAIENLNTGEHVIEPVTVCAKCFEEAEEIDIEKWIKGNMR